MPQLISRIALCSFDASRSSTIALTPPSSPRTMRPYPDGSSTRVVTTVSAAPDARWRATILRSVALSIAGRSPFRISRTAPRPAPTFRAACTTAWPVPRCSFCRTNASERSASASRTSSAWWPITVTIRRGESAFAATRTCATIGRPATGWRSLIVFERIRFPRPAASTSTVSGPRPAATSGPGWRRLDHVDEDRFVPDLREVVVVPDLEPHVRVEGDRLLEVGGRGLRVPLEGSHGGPGIEVAGVPRITLDGAVEERQRPVELPVVRLHDPLVVAVLRRLRLWPRTREPPLADRRVGLRALGQHGLLGAHRADRAEALESGPEVPPVQEVQSLGVPGERGLVRRGPLRGRLPGVRDGLGWRRSLLVRHLGVFPRRGRSWK